MPGFFNGNGNGNGKGKGKGNDKDKDKDEDEIGGLSTASRDETARLRSR